MELLEGCEWSARYRLSEALDLVADNDCSLTVLTAGFCSVEDGAGAVGNCSTLEEVGIEATGEWRGEEGWLWMVAGRLIDAIDCTPLRLYFDVGTNGLLAMLECIDERADMGAVGGWMSSLVISIFGSV
jgi:hypothetical protein